MQLTRIAGIPVRLHSSFVILGAGLVLWQVLSAGLQAAAVGVVMAVLLFGSVLLHELGHALTARFFGIGTRDITLYPFGGIAALRGEPRSALAELLIAVAGPAVNVLIALAALPFAFGGGVVATTVVVLNVGMAVFNLLPAYPMDGGRVLRAVLAPRHGYFGATARAIRVGRWLAWAMLAAGVVVSPQLLLVGGFLLFASWQEERRLRLLARQGENPWASSQTLDRAVRVVQTVQEEGRWAHPVA